MRKVIFLMLAVICFFETFDAQAIKPKRVYEQSPKDWDLNYKLNRIKVDSLISINSWYLQPVSNRKNVTIIISNGDYGNMGSFLQNGATLYDLGYDVVMYDYRGFGGSSQFATDTNLLFHTEYVNDLKNVYDFYKKQAPNKDFVLMGFSMGTIISTIFIAQDSLQNQLFIYDGFVNSIDGALSIINKSKQRHLKAPINDNVYSSYIEVLRPGRGLLFSGSKDRICKLNETTLNDFQVVEYDGGHLQGFYKLSENGITGSVYNNYIDEFIKGRKKNTNQ